jgi:major type 1 subunit fimbrin (pilin)
MAAQASDGTIGFTGELTDQTCTINSPGVGKDFVVALPRVSTANLKVLGDTAGATNFSINVSACSASIHGYSAYFEASQNINLSDGKLKNTSTATSVASNVEIELLNAGSTGAGSAIDLSKAFLSQGVTAGSFTPGASGSTGVGTSNFIARYYAL